MCGICILCQPYEIYLLHKLHTAVVHGVRHIFADIINHICLDPDNEISLFLFINITVWSTCYMYGKHMSKHWYKYHNGVAANGKFVYHHWQPLYIYKNDMDNMILYQNVCPLLVQHKLLVEGLVQDCSNSIANALVLVQFCSKPPWCGYPKTRTVMQSKINGFSLFPLSLWCLHWVQKLVWPLYCFP